MAKTKKLSGGIVLCGSTKPVSMCPNTALMLKRVGVAYAKTTHLASIEVNIRRVYQTITQQPNARTPELETTGGVRFFAEAKEAMDGRLFVSLPHGNRIYEEDWGFAANSMGKDGQRIAQYSVPLDHWIRTALAERAKR